ncbi:MAG TPA: hypothetical protein VG733_18370 [Chthoniobacteraceae bacterium]|nr:hypothetical protein [Chthoniobacteraceae bacterium]
MQPLQIIDVSCNHCGATLKVDEKTRFVTCSYCHSRLAIQRSDSAVFTEALEKIEEHTGGMAENLKLIQLQNELEQLDREWMMSRESLMVSGEHGSRYEPSAIAGVVLILFGLFGGGIWIYFTTSFMRQSSFPQGFPPGFPGHSSFGMPSIFPFFGVAFIIFGILGGMSVINKAGRLGDSRRSYEMRRSSLVGRINDEKRLQQPNDRTRP